MRKNLRILAALFGLPLLAVSSNPSRSPLHDTLYNEEQQLAAAEQRHDKAYFEKKLDDTMIYVAYNGLVLTKQKMLDSLLYLDVSRYSIENMKVRRLGSEAGLVTYDLRLKGNVAGHGLPETQYASSVWLKHGANWMLIFHQSTPAHHK